MNRLSTVWACAVAALVLVPAAAAAQTTIDTLAYELVEAMVSNDAARKGWLVVEFGDSIPTRYLNAGAQTLRPAAEWTIEVRDRKNPATAVLITVDAVYVAADPAQNRLVALQPSQPLDPATHQLRVRLLQGNYPDVVVGSPKKAHAAAFYGPARGKDDADLYFKGLVIVGPDGGPTYSVDGKAGYFTRLGRRGGSVGAKVTYVVDKASDLGPDSISLDAAYSKVLVLGPATGVVIDADVFGFEFDSENDTRNLASGATAQFVVPSLRVGPRSHTTADFLFGYEAGRNQTNNVTGDSLGGFWRTVVGVNGYVLLQSVPVFKRVDLIASWKVRLLAHEEPFVASSEAPVTLDDDARHLFTAKAELMVSKALGFSLSYRHGSEPPKYEHVRQRTEIGLVLKLKQVNKG